MKEFDSMMKKSMDHIGENIHAPKWDGGKYYGEINFYVTDLGVIEKIVIKVPSGHEGLDQSMVNSLLITKRLPMPTGEKVKAAMMLTQKLLFYSDKDMIR